MMFGADEEYFPPVSPFPFTRLASTALVGSTSSYLYHQINDTTIAEDQYDSSSGHWISTNITIKTDWQNQFVPIISLWSFGLFTIFFILHQAFVSLIEFLRWSSWIGWIDRQKGLAWDIIGIVWMFLKSIGFDLWNRVEKRFSSMCHVFFYMMDCDYRFDIH